jgi:hypothetical protein
MEVSCLLDFGSIGAEREQRGLNRDALRIAVGDVFSRGYEGFDGFLAALFRGLDGLEVLPWLGEQFVGNIGIHVCQSGFNMLRGNDTRGSVFAYRLDAVPLLLHSEEGHQE